MASNPVLVEVSRGGTVESFHRGAFAVVDADGTLRASAGDIDRPVFPRSSVKALQALPLVASGAAERLGLTDEELALTCASHGGEPMHAETAASMLAKAGLGPQALECVFGLVLVEQFVGSGDFVGGEGGGGGEKHGLDDLMGVHASTPWSSSLEVGSARGTGGASSASVSWSLL